jgi:hypothetical protein
MMQARPLKGGGIGSQIKPDFPRKLNSFQKKSEEEE